MKENTFIFKVTSPSIVPNFVVPTACATNMKYKVGSLLSFFWQFASKMQIENRKNLVRHILHSNVKTITFYETLGLSTGIVGKFIRVESEYSLFLFRLSISCRDQLFSNQLYLEVGASTSLSEAVANGSLTISVVSYRNLTHFLPKMYFSRNR